MIIATPRASRAGTAAGSLSGKGKAPGKQPPTAMPGAHSRTKLPPGQSKNQWKFVDRADEEVEMLLTSLIGMCHVNGQPRVDALKQLIKIMNERPPAGPRAVVSFIALRGLNAMVTVLGATCPVSRHLASKVLQEAVAFGHAEKVVECRSWFFQVQRNLENDNIETKASGAALLRVMPPSPESVAAIPALLRCLKVEMILVREEAAAALCQITRDKTCVGEMQHGAIIQDVIQHFRSNGSVIVRERCSAILVVLARASSAHRTKIVRNEGVITMIESLASHLPEKMIDNVLIALKHMSPEERARRFFREHHLTDKLYDIVCGVGDFHSTARRQAFSLLETLNKTPEGAMREPFGGIGALTSEQDCFGLAQLFSLLPTAFICWRVRRVSRCWRRVTGMPETWQRVDFDRCTFLTAHKLRDFLAHAPLTITQEASFFGCSKVESDGFKQLSEAMTGQLLSLEMSECENLKDDALVHLMKTSEGFLASLTLAGCRLLTNRSMYGIVAHLDTSLRVLVLNRCSWLRDDAIMLLTGACRWLKRLGIAECSGLTSECLGAVSYANGLTDLDLSLNDFVTDEGLALIANKVTGLTNLDISGCGLITDEGVNPIARLSNITALDLSGNMLVSDPAIIAIAEGCPRLASLKCMMMPALTSKPIQVLGAKCAELRVLDLSYLALISDIGLRSVVRCCKGLIDLNLAWCESLSQGSFQYIAQFCRALERLNISTTAVGDAEALAILDQCRSLLEITLVDCRRLSVQGLEAVLVNAICDSRFTPVNVLTGRPDSTQSRGGRLPPAASLRGQSTFSRGQNSASTLQIL